MPFAHVLHSSYVFKGFGGSDPASDIERVRFIGCRDSKHSAICSTGAALSHLHP